jgi:hypothetical protein
MDSPQDAVAVGWEGIRGRIERWDGSQWRHEANTYHVQDDVFMGVASTSYVDGWAVGAKFGSAGSLNGARAVSPSGSARRVVPSPNRTADASTGAEGGAQVEIPNRSVIWQYDGFRWHQADHPAKLVHNTALYGAAATGPDDVWAVGVSDMQWSRKDYYAARRPLIEHWNGSAWTVMPGPLPGTTQNVLISAAAVSPTDAWAVGWYRDDGPRIPWVIHYDGSTWTQEDVPLPGGTARLWSVSANGPDDVWAVGDRELLHHRYQPFAEHYDGQGWTLVTMPSKQQTAVIEAVDAEDGAQWAVGERSVTTSGGGRRDVALVERRCDAS